MLHDRFYGQWDQPTSPLQSGKLVTVIWIKIARDGRILGSRIATPSGEVVMDESVQAALGRVSRVDPLPSAIPGESWEVKIAFERE